LKLIPDNLFAITTSDEFVKISGVINSIILNHRQEVNALIDSLNIVEGDGRHGWNYSNFKIRNWYKEYQKYLSQHDRKGDTNMQLKGSRLLINSKKYYSSRRTRYWQNIFGKINGSRYYQ
ncbi:hypothetical protein KQ236_14540, partial [Lactococcus lactis]|nr:hypothetical protein [Lactococcus lactis]